MAHSIRPIVCLGLALAAPVGPVRAATITTDAFVAVTRPTVQFLGAAGRLALAQADSRRVHAFARAEVDSQDRAERTLDTWRLADAATAARDAGGTTLDRLGPAAGLLKLPYEAVAATTTFVSPPLTGLPSTGRLQDAAQEDLAHLAALRGPAFTTLYTATQIEALERLVAAYKDFILNGDDPLLRRLAVEALPKVEALLARARRL